MFTYVDNVYERGDTKRDEHQMPDSDPTVPERLAALREAGIWGFTLAEYQQWQDAQ